MKQYQRVFMKTNNPNFQLQSLINPPKVLEQRSIQKTDTEIKELVQNILRGDYDFEAEEKRLNQMIESANP